MLRFEFKKQLTAFGILLTVTMFSLNLAVAAFFWRDGFSSDARDAAEARDELLALYESDRARYDEIYADFRSRVSAYEAEQYTYLLSNDGRALSVFENKLIDTDSYGDMQLFADLDAIINRPESYRDALLGLLSDSAKRIQELDGGYLYSYYSNLLRIYDRTADLSLPVAEARGWNEFFSLSTSTLFLAAALLGLYSGCFTLEGRCGMTNILRVSKYGGRRLAAAKLGYVTISSALLSLAFTLSPLILLALSCGLSDPTLPIQLLDGFTLCRYTISIGEYLVVFSLTRMLVFWVFSLAVAYLGELCGSELPAFALTALLAALGAAMSSIAPTSELWFLAKFSPTSIAGVNILYERYWGLNIFNHCADYTIVSLVLLIFAAALLILLPIVYRPREVVRVRREKKRRVYTPRFSPRRSLFSTEVYKLLCADAGLYVLAAAVILQAIFSFVYYKPNQGSTETLYRGYIEKVAGPPSDEKSAYIDSEREYIESTLAQYDSMRQKRRSGEITNDEYNEYLGRYNYAEFSENACDLLCERRDYLDTVRDEYPGVEYVYEEGVKRLLASPPSYALLLAAIFVLSDLFAFEYAGFAPILRLTRHGRELHRHKFLLALLLGLTLFVIVSLIELCCLAVYYDVDYLSVDLASLPDYASLGGVTVGQYLLRYKLVSLFGYLELCAAAAGMSCLAETRAKAATLSAICVFLPYLLCEYSVTPAYPLNLAGAVAPASITWGLAAMCVYAAVTAVIAAAVRRKWRGHTANAARL